MTRIPSATYRIQLHGGTTLDDVADLAPYLAALGVSDLYLSPVLVAPAGAAHGYHVLDPTQVDPQLGGDAALSRLRAATEPLGMGLLVDIVPNHLAASPENPWWRDVLENGPASTYARAFDIDWEAGGGQVVLPLLGRPLEEVLAAGELTVEDGELVYSDIRLPLAPGTPEPDDLEGVLDAQHYRLAFWRTGVEELNYRRFFDITDLVGVRVEDPEVFEWSHRLVLDLVHDGTVTGLRVDHVDGLRDPLGYLRRLEAAAGDAATEPPYVVVEKILEGDEPLPEEWPVAGTTGYEFLSAVNAVQVDTDGLARLDDAYTSFTGRTDHAPDVLREKKAEALETLFRGEVGRLARRLVGLAKRVPDAPGVDEDAMRGAIVAVTAAFPVYRTYVRDTSLRADDRSRLEQAFAAVRRGDPGVDRAALELLKRVLTVDVPAHLDADDQGDWLDIVARWQQLTGPAMAKGLEDTSFYVVTRLASLNEVGVDAHGMESPHGVGGFHARMERRAEAWPCAMSATSTHDTKRSEDVRARLNVLTEMAEDWAETAARWHERTAAARAEAGAPAPAEEWLLYQSLVGMWPLDEAEETTVRERLKKYAVKAAREAKVSTSWLDPDEAYEAGLEQFVDAILGDAGFVEEVRHLVDRIALPGVVNSLAQLAVKLLAPGVPDVYQGCELWDWSLVDPDNRRPVDFAARRRAVEEVGAAADRLVLARELRDTWWDGRLKLYVTWALLQLRRERPLLMRVGGYEPLETAGTHAARVTAFARTRAGEWAAVVAPRLVARLGPPGHWPTGDAWADTTVTLPTGARATEVLTGRPLMTGDGQVRLADVLRKLPVAVLVTNG
jgi:(1->4)-alpha-D-glucan 1-alpha-D-glucosylmutase